ncbi:hypothetical protein [Marinitoga sp. 38H-ov]|uniref:hypothetical protein n=1 Tax=Marinitoga sp. 38H-ov TaxID=1755814 RepID=UPI0013E9E013|nr:hypothetical protein [Marinitoga sp. 38H-ov]KAF2956888.1 hypothetical protein AS160_03575 [Marinitoga sp. 38H-ov]
MIILLSSCFLVETNDILDFNIVFKENYIELSWNQISSAEKYEIYKKGINDNEYKLVANVNNKVTKYEDYIFDPHQTYLYQIVYFKKNYVSEPVEKKITIPNRLPSKVSIISPSEGSTISPKNFKIIWNKPTDKDGDELEYTIVIKENNVVVKSDKVKSLEYIVNLNYARTYTLRIDVSDGYSLVKGDEISFNTQDIPISLSTPQLNISNVSTSSITLSWENINEATKYEIYRKNNNIYELLSKTSELQYIDKSLERKKEYFYKIRAIKEENNDIVGISNYSNEISAITINYPPEIPELIYPSNNATGIDLNEKLKWESFDPDGDKIKYTVYFSDNRNYVEDKKENAKVAENITEKEFLPKMYIKNTYYWKVIAMDEYGDVSESDIFSFSTKDIENTKPNIDIPEQNITENSTLNINLINYSYDADGDDLIFDLISGPGTIVTTNDSTNYIYYADYEASGIYDVTLRISDRYEYIDYTFTIIVENINRSPNILSHSVNPVAKYGGIEVKNVTLSWGVSDPDGDNLKCTLYLSDDITKVENNDEEVKIIEDYDKNTYNLENELKYQTKYYWKIIVNDGKSYVESKIFDFTTKEEPAIIYIEDAQFKINESNYILVNLEKGNDVGGISFIFTFNSEYINVDINKGLSGVEWLFDKDNIYFSKVTNGDNYLKVDIVFKESYSIFNDALLKIYLNGIKNTNETIIGFSNAYGVHSSSNKFEIDYSDIAKIQIF